MALSPSSPSIAAVVLAFVFLRLAAPSSSKTEADTLLKFKESLKNATALASWNTAKARAPCAAGRTTWPGVLCDGDKVLGLSLNGMGLSGSIDVDSLLELPSFLVFGAMDNNFHGPLPAFKKLSALKFLYLSRNKFSGVIPDDAFVGMESLKKVHLAFNEFSGAIPTSLASSRTLIELMLEDNMFYGKLPDFSQERLSVANFSDNNLEGEIPPILSTLGASSFAGNSGLCGKPLAACHAGQDDTVDSNNSNSMIVSLIAAVLVLAVAIAIIFIVCKKKPKDDAPDGSTRAQVGTQTAAASAVAATTQQMDRMERGSQAARPPERATAAGGKKPAEQHQHQAAAVKLSFLRENVAKFDLPDLLKASAEILGNGVFGATYKAALNSAQVVVVKRFKHMNKVGKEDFVEHMRRLGRLDHKNLLPILAFYYRKEEKLLVFNHVQKSSLASHLHGKKHRSRTGKDLDWAIRLKIVKGVARSMLYLYNELPSVNVPNGHLKSSNVLLDSSYEPLISDYGLLPIVNQEHAEEHMTAYKSPDFKQGGRVSKKTDVWALGVMILEILTGKHPPDVDTAAWVQSIEPTPEALDPEMRGVTKNAEGEVVKLLSIGLSCCEVNVEKRSEMKETVERIEQVREKDAGDDDFYSSYTSDDRSSRGFSEDFGHASFNA
ncbi:PREDICTED: pollen receptor-like kinase 2 [Ipomoea nil]|uniref:pollen receptor-like kinase 2 n=1 Tax=Ipomoea nil TaxID=35883 RepID=UPI0009012D73|nr:PREDICTED: pollen receptor-like kinase 2 [Ipomoea nil]